MIITKDFVLLNNPKTGSTYARQVVKTVYEKQPSSNSIFQRLKLINTPYQELKLKNIQFPNRPKNQHGTYSQIPSKYLNRQIVSVIRNPYDKFASAYEYQYWLKQPPEQSTLDELGISDLESISIDQFTQIQIASIEKRYPNLSELKVGSQTIQFIFMYFKNPSSVIKLLTEDYFFSGAYKNDLPKITFINQSKLSEDLISFLDQFKNDKSKLNEARQIGRVNINNKRASLDSYPWTEFAISYINTYERFLLYMLQELGFQFEKPKVSSPNEATTKTEQ